LLLAFWFYMVGAILLTTAGAMAFWASAQPAEDQ